MEIIVLRAYTLTGEISINKNLFEALASENFIDTENIEFKLDRKKENYIIKPEDFCPDRTSRRAIKLVRKYSLMVRSIDEYECCLSDDTICCLINIPISAESYVLPSYIMSVYSEDVICYYNGELFKYSLDKNDPTHKIRLRKVFG